MTKLMAKKMPNDGLASSLIARRNGIASPFFPEGGVWGRKRLKIANPTDIAAAISSGRLVAPEPFGRKSTTAQPAAIHPIVPSTRSVGKSRVASGTLANDIELAI